MNKTAVVIARFQTPFLHPGHRLLLDGIAARHHRTVVVLGVSPVKGGKRNPYDFYTRERMLKAAYPNLFVLPLPDHPSDAAWSNSLDALLAQTFPGESFLLYGGRNSFIAAYSGKLPVEELPEQSGHSATAIRTALSDKVLSSEDFRLGINYACQNRYAKVYPTVDVALFKEERSYLLLGRKLGRPEWRLPGGFADAGDADFESAARRELCEECGGVETTAMHYIGSAKIDDWRYRSEEDKIITMLFAADLVYGHPEAGDDLERVQWFAVDGLERMMDEGRIAKEHHALMLLLLQKAAAQKQIFTQNETI